ncbi:MAG: pseudouridine synthase [Bacteroidales bacterium]|nr:pseudouridine synthase [Bacteroidales bacterium]
MENNDHSRREDGKPQRQRRNFRNDDNPEKHPYRKSYGDDSRPKRPFRKDGDNDKPRHSFFKDSNGDSRPKRPFRKDEDDNRPRHSFFKDNNGDSSRPKRPFRKDEDDNRPRHSFFKDNNGDGSRPKRPFRKDGDNDKPKYSFHNEEDSSRPRHSFHKDNDGHHPKHSFYKDGDNPRKSFKKSGDKGSTKQFATRNDDADFSYRKKKNGKIPETARPNPANKGLKRLNKYIADAGICSRREADKLISAGAVTVNGQVITEMGFKVKPGDVVTYGGETLKDERKRYFLLNKPKGYITTSDDPQERHTVMELVADACKERIYPVGRLDRNTTGLLLFTNDGDMSLKLTHPSTGVYKIYHVELNRSLSSEDMRRIREGIELEDGPIKVDDVQYAGDGIDKNVVGVSLHSGRNRIVRRIFESLGYEVHKLDRVVFAGLTKKDLPRGRYRELTEKEVSFLKMI